MHQVCDTSTLQQPTLRPVCGFRPCLHPITALQDVPAAGDLLVVVVLGQCHAGGGVLPWGKQQMQGRLYATAPSAAATGSGLYKQTCPQGMSPT
jgi:hypothetical protein